MWISNQTGTTAAVAESAAITTNFVQTASASAGMDTKSAGEDVFM